MSGFLITLILFFTGLWIIYEAFQGFLQPSEVILSPLVLGVMIFSAATNEVMARAKIHYGKLENSVSLLSDGVHSRVDVYTSIAVFVGLILSKYWIYIDSLLALLIGIYIIKKSLSLGKETTDSLLDVSAGEETEERIRNLVKEENIEISELKTQKKGFVVTANMKIELPSKLSVDEAAKISDKLKEKLMAGIKNLGYVAIQIESHDMSSSFFKSRVFDLAEGRGFGWQRRGKFRGKIKEAQGAGPEGHCICEKCGYKTKHERGIPCSTLKCPRCKINLKRG
jgi:cation diffusion facilitator family transporter